ncbi:hypothetical protein HNY73_004312 [Argiope bruennichi]|uniref:Uncharacterized protein n=1 Tax=Argiope bruennichi TaxID=94029 RepID=A0A8T0FTA5_ARGBR|nr:hypothetical protein HNY73_004312 [Argiope bruennichi]
MVEWSTLKLSARIRVVKLSSPTDAKSAWLSKSNGRSHLVLSAKLGSPYLKRIDHSLHRLSLIVPSPKSSLKSRNDCAAFHPLSKWHSIISRIWV